MDVTVGLGVGMLVRVGVGCVAIGVWGITGTFGVSEFEISGSAVLLGWLQPAQSSKIKKQSNETSNCFFFIAYRPLSVSVIFTVIQS